MGLIRILKTQLSEIMKQEQNRILGKTVFTWKPSTVNDKVKVFLAQRHKRATSMYIHIKMQMANQQLRLRMTM
jgi:hypothetical protein